MASHHIIFRTVLCKVDMKMQIIDTLMNPPTASKDNPSARHSVKSNASSLEVKKSELGAVVVKKKFVDQVADIFHQRDKIRRQELIKGTTDTAS